MRSNACSVCVGRHDHLPERIVVLPRRLELDGLGRACQRQAGDDGLAVDRELGVCQALAGGLEHGSETVVQPQANVGRARHALAENDAGTIAKAGPTVRAAAVDSKKKQALIHLCSSTLTLIYG
jgi:hypothetical protein